MPVKYDYDLIAIGGGSGGLSVVERAAVYGARVALIEASRIGGTCVNAGCVPKKIMWYAAMLRHGLKDAVDYGFDVDVRGFDWATLIEKREAYISNINSWYHTYPRRFEHRRDQGLCAFRRRAYDRSRRPAYQRGTLRDFDRHFAGDAGHPRRR